MLEHGFGDEAGADAMLLGDFDDDPFEQAGFIRRSEYVGVMVEIDLELTRGVFRNRSFSRDVLRIAPFVNVVEEFLNLKQVIGMVDLRARLRAVSTRHFRCANPDVGRVRIEQVKLQFRRDDWF